MGWTGSSTQSRRSECSMPGAAQAPAHRRESRETRAARKAEKVSSAFCACPPLPRGGCALLLHSGTAVESCCGQLRLLLDAEGCPCCTAARVRQQALRRHALQGRATEPPGRSTQRNMLPCCPSPPSSCHAFVLLCWLAGRLRTLHCTAPPAPLKSEWCCPSA